MVGEVQPEIGLQPVEILHIDTAGSREFFGRLEVNPSEKCDCQKILLDLFSECCQQFGGYVAANWQGDGGHAFFPAKQKSGNSVLAARDFISKLSVLAQQTATTLGRRKTPDQARRRFRIKAHFGNVYLTADGKCDAGFSGDFDSFLKHERALAPVPDELFITDQLRTQIGGPEKTLFERFKETESFDSLRTALYRLKSQPTNHARNILAGGLQPKDITDSEWQFLRNHILAQRMNVVARNSIATGLIKAITPQSSGHVDPSTLASLTVRALYNYLRAVYPFYKFQVTMWKPAERGGAQVLEKAAMHPLKPTTANRTVSLVDMHYQVARCFSACSPVVTQCVSESRLGGEWIDFDSAQAELSRGLQSAIQLPIYRTKNEIGDFLQKEPLGVLSVDCDKPDFFLKDELDLWNDDLVGYLANLALSEHMRRHESLPRGTGVPS